MNRILGREQERNLATGTIRQALIDGERSGEPERFDFAAFKKRKTSQHS